MNIEEVREYALSMNEQVTVTQKGNKFTVKWKKAKSKLGIPQLWGNRIRAEKAITRFV